MDPDVSRINMTFGVGVVDEPGFNNSNSVSSATTGAAASITYAKPALIHVNFCVKIFMILASICSQISKRDID
jgi:hypothetical protein